MALAALGLIGGGAGIQALAVTPIRRWPYALAYVLCAFLLAGGAALGLRKHPKIFAAVFAAVSFGAALSVAFWAQTEPVAEYARMLQTALDLRAGQWDAIRGNEYYHAWAYQSGFVLYEALIFLIFPAKAASLLVVNALAVAGINFMLYTLLCRVCSPETAIFLAVVYLCHPTQYLLVSVLTNQHISLLLLLSGLCLLGRGGWRGAVTGGMCLALACATRPDAQLVYPALAALTFLIWLCSEKKTGESGGLSRVPGRGRAAQWLAGVCHAPYRWPLLSAAAGMMMGWLLSLLVALTGLNPGGLRNYDPLWKLALGLNIETEGRFDMELAGTLLAAEDLTERTRLEREIIERNVSRGTGTMTAFLAGKLLRSWREYEPASWAFAGQETRVVPVLNRPLGTVLPIVLAAERWLTLCLAALGCITLIRSFRRGADASTALCALMILCFILVHAVVEFQPRYRYMLWPFVALIASGGAEWIRRPLRAAASAARAVK